MHEAKTDRIEGRNRQFNNNSWTLQHLTFNNKDNQTEDEQGNGRLEETSLNNFTRVEIIQSMFSNQNVMKLEINNRRKFGKFTNMWKLNSIFLNNQWVKAEITSEIRKLFE